MRNITNYNDVTYHAEFLGLIPRTDELNRPVGEMYYRCKVWDCGTEKNAIIRFPKVLLNAVEINMAYTDYMYGLDESYIKLKIEPVNKTFFEIIVEEENMPTGNYANLFKDLNNMTFTLSYKPKFDKNDVKDVIFNNPATIVFWKDGTKTVVKCQKGDTYNPELGLAMCIIKKMCDNKGNYNDVFNKWLPAESK